MAHWPANLKEIEDGAFQGCDKLDPPKWTDVVVDKDAFRKTWSTRLREQSESAGGVFANILTMLVLMPWLWAIPAILFIVALIAGFLFIWRLNP